MHYVCMHTHMHDMCVCGHMYITYASHPIPSQPYTHINIDTHTHMNTLRCIVPKVSHKIHFTQGGGGGGGGGVTHLVPDSMITMCNTRHSQMGTLPHLQLHST